MVRVDRTRTLFTLAVLVAALWGVLFWLHPTGPAVVLQHPASPAADTVILTK